MTPEQIAADQAEHQRLLAKTSEVGRSFRSQGHYQSDKFSLRHLGGLDAADRAARREDDPERLPKAAQDRRTLGSRLDEGVRMRAGEVERGVSELEQFSNTIRRL